MINEFDLVEGKNDEKLNNLNMELKKINKKLNDYREEKIHEKLKPIIKSKEGSSFENLTFDEKDKIFKKYYNDELEVDYNKLKSDYKISYKIIS